MSRRPPRALARALAAGLAALAVAGLAACASIPSSGPVERRDVTVSELGPIFPQSPGPTPGASPREIVQGFLGAQAVGLNDDWATAREFLSPDMAQAWDPSARTTVYSGEPQLTPAAGTDPALLDQAPGTATPEAVPTQDPASGTASTGPETAAPEPTEVSILGRVSVVAALDPDGRYTEDAQGTGQDLSFTLTRSAQGQWRISATEDGVVVSDPNFGLVYRPTTLYFPTVDRAFLVPEVRWYSKSNTATHAVNGVLAGPSDWLRDSVTVVAPAGTRLLLDSVTIDESGVARVDLSKEVLTASDADRAMLQAQLEAVLLKVPRVRSVELLASSLPLSVAGRVSPQRDPVPTLSTPYVLAGDVVSQVQGADLEPVDRFLPLSGFGTTAIATDDRGELVVARAGTTSVVRAPTVAAPSATLLTGTDLLAPTIDRFGWVWSGERSYDGGLRVATEDGVQASVPADWLEGRTVDSIRVSHDGTRIAVVSTEAGVSRIEVAAIVRDDSSVPVRLSDDALAIGASVQSASQVVWVDESTVAVLARGQSSGIPTVYEVPLSGRSSALSGVEGTEWVAAGRGLRSLYVATSDGELFGRTTSGSSWSPVVDDARLPAFPG